MPWVRIRAGDSVQNLAARHGLLPDTIWDHADNQELREQRGDQAVLYPGDELFVPEKTAKAVDCSDGAKHSFVRKRAQSKFRMQFLWNGEPCDDDGYTISIDGEIREGRTDGDGWIDEPVSPDTKWVSVVFEDGTEYEYRLGHLDPVDELEGVQGRLRGLGLYAGKPHGRLDEDTVAAIEAFQGVHELDVTGEPDDATREKLVAEFGS